VAFDVELPAVIAAADPVGLDVAEEQAGPAVHAAWIEQARSPLAVAEYDQVLARMRTSRGRAVTLRLAAGDDPPGVTFENGAVVKVPSGNFFTA
jgi:hypothetical protein